MGEYPHVRVTGSAEERGRQYGEQTRDRVHRSVGAYRDVFASMVGWDWETVRGEAARFEAPIAAFNPRYVAEMRGIADGAGIDFTDVLAINVRTEVMFAAKARHAATASKAGTSSQAAPTGRPGECSSFAIAPAPGHPGPTLLGQNWDWLPHSAETVVVLEVAQDEGPDFVTVVEAGLLAKTGMNAAGLGLVTNALVTADDLGEPGLPYHVMLRAIMDCESVSDAITSLQAGPRSSSANYLLAHRDGVAIDVEGSPGDFSRLYFLYPDGGYADGSGILLHTNHFLADRFAGTDVSVWVMPDSPVRLQRLRAGVQAAPELSLDTFRALLSDHANYPSGVCCHPDPKMAPADQGMTVTSVLMDLGAGRMWLSDGNPCTAPYREVDYSGFLSWPASEAGSAGSSQAAA
ncbi:MAG: C45 family peptidase [Nocardiopsaceae bacterium]|jgi:isopenicillin-N N-acyltransferase-like protein|nr:C45 family peptidase [Nocardiopsaceae bacterium]